MGSSDITASHKLHLDQTEKLAMYQYGLAEVSACDGYGRKTGFRNNVTEEQHIDLRAHLQVFNNNYYCIKV